MAALPIQVNLIPGYDRVPPVVKLNQYEYGLTRQFEVYYGGEKYTIPSGSTVRIEGTKPDRTGYSYAASFSGSIITVTIKEQMTVLAGYHEAELVIIPSTTLRASTINLRMDVERGALGKDVPISETELPAIIDAARSFASAAESSANDAANSANNAHGSEISAASSEENAIAAANAAAESESAAATSASQANSSKNAAAASANSAQTSELQAKDYKDSAEESANRAQMYAGLTVPGLRVDPVTQELIQDDDVDRLYFVYNSSNGQLSYELTS